MIKDLVMKFYYYQKYFLKKFLFNKILIPLPIYSPSTFKIIRKILSTNYRTILVKGTNFYK